MLLGKTALPDPADRVRQPENRAFLVRLIVLAWVVRLAVVIIFSMTDAIQILHLSPDSYRYHVYGVNIMQEMNRGVFNWPNWIDNGWFQFTGFVYYLIGPYPFLIQLVNITLSALTIVPVYLIAREISDDPRVRRMSAILTAFFPSFIYWSVLMLKDPAAIFALALIGYGVTVLRLRFRMTALFWIVFGLLIFLGTREYLFIVLIFLICASFLLFPYRPARNLLRAVMVCVIVALLPAIFGLGVFGWTFIGTSAYFDLDKLNHIRVAMGDHGTGALFDHGNVHTWGNSWTSDIFAILKTVFSVFIPVNPADIGSPRQLMAVPEIIIIIFLIRPLFHGLAILWKTRQKAIPLLVICFGVLAVYVAGTTNAGALFRWKTQIMPFFFIMMAVGIFYLEKGIVYRLLNRFVGKRRTTFEPPIQPVKPLLS